MLQGGFVFQVLKGRRVHHSLRCLEQSSQPLRHNLHHIGKMCNTIKSISFSNLTWKATRGFAKDLGKLSSAFWGSVGVAIDRSSNNTCSLSKASTYDYSLALTVLKVEALARLFWHLEDWTFSGLRRWSPCPGLLALFVQTVLLATT